MVPHSWFEDDTIYAIRSVPQKPFVQLSVSIEHACGLLETGQAVCWGRNCAIVPGGSLVCWGQESGSQANLVASDKFIQILAGKQYLWYAF